MENRTQKFRVGGMTCTACSSRVEKAVSKPSQSLAKTNSKNKQDKINLSNGTTVTTGKVHTP